ncbi:MAG: hypothetical protein HN738_08530 [Gammaproteobacteria bacterium]|jgi:hypothetical protein|nr:hypothetical protein [Gammaproteobacteria bacterium]
MGKSSKTPDYEGSAKREAAENFRNLEYQTRANRPNMSSPYGTSSWTELGNGNWSNEVNLSPELQRALDSQLGLQSGRSELAAGMLGNVGRDMQTSDDFWSSLPNYSYSPQTVDVSGYGNEFKTVGAREGVVNRDWQNNMEAWHKPSGDGIGFTGMGNKGQPPGSEGMWEREPYAGRQVRVIPERPDGPNQTTNSRATAFRMRNADPQNLYGLSEVDAQYDPRFEEAMYNRTMSLLRPEQQQNSAANRTMLANMGLSQGGEAYDDSVYDLRNQQDEATQRVAWDSVLRGAEEYNRDFQRQLAERGQQFTESSFNEQRRLQEEGQDFTQQLGRAGFGEAQRAAAFGEQKDKYDLQFKQFNQGLQAAGFNNTVRNQQIVDQMQREGWSLNKINALISGQQVNAPQFQDFSQAGYTAGADYTGAAGQQSQYNSSVNNMWGNILSGVATGAGYMFGGPAGGAAAGAATRGLMGGS